MVKSLFLPLLGYLLMPGNPIDPPSSVSSDFNCALPGPKNVVVAIDGSNYIQLAWDPVPEAAYFRVNVYRADNHEIAHSKLVTALPQNNSIVLDSIAPGLDYNFSVYSVCANGMVSPKEHQH